MPRRRRHDKISEYHLQAIERQVGHLKAEVAQASLSLTPFRLHYDTLRELNAAVDRALNLLHGRPGDYQKPHASLMSRASGGGSETR